MSAHQLAIAKASFSAGLLRPDPTSVPRDEISHFHTLLDRAVNQCSPSNIQQCKIWVTRNVFPSSARITAIGKYLVALTASFVPQNDVAATERRKPSPKRKRLHLLYLLNDLFHESKYHGGSSSSFASLTGQIQPYLVELFGLAAAFEREKCPKHHKRIEDLLDLWDKNGYYAPQYVEKLRETAWNAAQLGPVALDAARQAEGGFSTPSDKIRDTKNIPFVMPANHGDPSIPYYDLPAGNMMPHIIPNSTAPINPQLMKPLQFVAGPADESLVTVVKDFLQDVNNTFDQEADIDNGTVQDIDELGQPIILDEVSGERLGEAYYGWSHAFCEKMKRRREGASGTDTRGTSRGRSRSASPRRSRRYGSSRSLSSGSRIRERSQSHSRSPSYPRDRDSRARFTGRYRSRSRPRAYSRSQSRSRSPRWENDGSGKPSRSRSGSRSRSPIFRPPSSSNFAGSIPPQLPTHSPTPYQAPFPNSSIPPSPFPGPLGAGFPLGPSGLPVPPPPPPFHGHGQWPPPPPPLPPNVPFHQNVPFPPFPGFVPPPPPPPPPPGPPSQHPLGGYQAMGGSPSHASPPGPWNAPTVPSGDNLHRTHYRGRGGGVGGGGRREWRG